MNPRVLLPILALFTCIHSVSAQQWTTRYGSSAGVVDESVDMVTANERVYIAGSTTSSAGDWNMVIMCLDRSGATVWTHEYGTVNDEKATAISVDANGNSYVLGSVWESDMRWHGVLLKYNQQGALQWSKVFTNSAASSDIPADLALIGTNTILVASASTMPDATVASVVTAFDDDAGELWSDVYTGNGNAWPIGIAGGAQAAVVGTTTGGNDGDAFVIRYNADGTRTWAHTYDGGSGRAETFSEVAFDSQGSVLCAGWTATAPASTEVLYVQYDQAGMLTDSDAYTPGDAGRHRATALNVDNADNPLLAARIEAGSGDFNMYLNRRGPDAWQRVYSPSGGTSGDNSAPSFRGASAAFVSGEGQMTVVWHAATDNLAMRDELSYNVYVATTPGGQNFSMPTKVISAANEAVVDGLLPGGTYYVVVRAVDFAMNEDGNTREWSVHLDLPPLRVTTSALPDAMPGTAYVATVAAEGGQPPYRWMLSSGDLPPGIDFDEDGSFSGTPVDDGTSSLQLRVYDAAGDSADAQLDLLSVTPAALDVQTDMTLSGGEYWYSTVMVASSATLTLTGDVVIHAVDDVQIDGDVLALCSAIELRGTESLTLDGSISNVCNPPAAVSPDILIVVDGELMIGSSPSPDPAIISDGNIMITDTFTEDADLTPISLEEIRRGGSGTENAHTGSAHVARAGRGTVNRPPQARRGGTTSVARDGDIDVNVNMSAANGADAGGATVVGGSGGTLSFGSRNGTLTFAAGTVLSAGDGGKGASVVATGCPAVADASASKGGRGGSILVGGKSVVFGAGVVLNRGNGGMGGDATATADAAAGPCANGCDAQATSGPGGEKGGIGYVLTLPGAGIIGAPTEGGGNGGKGGLATAIASDGTACLTCPGGKGGDGGMATATGGKGGEGATGKIWPIVAGSHKAGDGGDAVATGGKGGKGASCCTPPMPGGDGGSGKNASATGGDPGAKGLNPGVPGTYTAQGGSAGAGGDGKGAGAAGGVGSGTGVGTAGTKADGTPANGGIFCFNIHFWFIYFSTLPDGFITPGIPMKLKACPTQDVNSQEAEAEVAFLTYDENGGNDVMYQKQNDDVVIVSGGLKINPAGTDHPQFPGATWWSGGLQLQFMAMNPSQSGQVAIHGLDAQGQVIGQNVVQLGPSSPPVSSVALQAPQGTVYHQVIVRTTVPIRFNHWWMAGWFIDP